jgi:hypothetical protein
MEQNNKELMSPFHAKMQQFVGSIPNSRYIIEVSKFCGYSEFVLVFKNQTLLDLYKTVSLQFECNNIKGLYLTKSREHSIPITDNIRIRDYIFQDQSKIIKPAYPMPYPIVYKFYLDDGHYCIEVEPDAKHV